MYGIAYSNRNVIADFDCLGILARSSIGEIAADALTGDGVQEWLYLVGTIGPCILNSIHEHNGDSATESTFLHVDHKGSIHK